jgi:hypothetical protein
MLLQLVLLLHVPGSAMPRIPCIHMSPRACCRLWQLSLVPRYRHLRSCTSWTLALWSSADWMNDVEWVSRSRCKSPNRETCKRRRASHRSLLLSLSLHHHASCLEFGALRRLRSSALCEAPKSRYWLWQCFTFYNLFSVACSAH